MTGFLAFETFQRSPRPNDYLVAPEGETEAVVDRAAPEFSVTPEALFDKIKSLLDQDSGYQGIEADPAQGRLKAVAVTALLRFKDDVDIRTMVSETGSTLAIYSRSRIGGGDLGANRKRVEKLLARLHDQTGT